MPITRFCEMATRRGSGLMGGGLERAESVEGVGCEGDGLKGWWHRRVERRRASNFFINDQLRGGTRVSGCQKKGDR